MAVTSGHGNPKWTREETILALDFYFDCEGRIPSAKDKRVQLLSEFLRAFPYHNIAARKGVRPQARLEKVRASLHKELARLAFEKDMRGFIMNALKEKGLNVTEEDLIDRRRK